MFGFTSRAARVCAGTVLAVGVALAIPSVAMAGGPEAPGGTGCGYFHVGADNNSTFWKNCSNHDEWVQLAGIGDGKMCVQAGHDPFLGYKVEPSGTEDMRNAYLIADSCPPGERRM
ncbi:MAG TPA: hypothetical protein VHU91_04525 [Mycobacteriales bacterium]|jgi:hypothetical protein|nr:hypothetical protein [Mycobacteriales bacterium]